MTAALGPRGRVAVGSILIVAGVGLHAADFLAAAPKYRLVDMPVSSFMWLGMGLIVVGLPLAASGLWRRPLPARSEPAMPPASPSSLGERLTPLKLAVAGALAVALVIDVMKPATLGFIIPGSRAEYDLSTAEVALYPMAGLTGTMLGSVLWGALGDRLGRRGSIILASLTFIATAVCGAMPAFGLNLLMCFLMGLAAGGMLPLVFALIAEIMPLRHRGWIGVLIGGLGGVGGYLAASASATVLEPIFGWRILWLLGLPTGLLLLALLPLIPESPRLLLLQGRPREVEAVVRRFGLSSPAPGSAPAAAANRASVSALLRYPYRGPTVALALYGLAWGLVFFGFLSWLPSILRDMGESVAGANGLLASSALLALPATLLVAALYGAWSRRRSLVLFAGLTAGALGGIAAWDLLGGAPIWLTVLLVALILGSSGVNAMLPPYAAELYPTAVRATGTGLIAGAGKMGGIVGPPLAAAALLAAPGLTAPALLTGIPLALAAWLIGRTPRPDGEPQS